MQETNSPKHPLLGWILIKYAKITLIPSILYICLHINKTMDVIQDTTNTLDPSLMSQSQEKYLSSSNPFVATHELMQNILPYISLGVAILAFMYASSFTMSLIYHKTKIDTEYRKLDSYNIDAYKQDVNQLTPTLFFILLGLSILYSKMG